MLEVRMLEFPQKGDECGHLVLRVQSYLGCIYV